MAIAGSDSGGGAGIQADLKAFARCGVHGTTAITAITAQNTVGVQAVHAVPPEIIVAQVRAVLADIGADAVKVGMLGTVATVRAVACALDELPAQTPVVVDPVMVAESGARLLDADAEGALVEEILPRATVLTPNLPEARALARRTQRSGPGTGVSRLPDAARDDESEQAEAEELARQLLAMGPRAVVLTGGHRVRAVDLLLERGRESAPLAIEGERHPDGAAHGSGCTHSSVLAAQLALGRSIRAAAQLARQLSGGAVAGGLRSIGAGAGPVDVLDLPAMCVDPATRLP